MKTISKVLFLYPALGIVCVMTAGCNTQEKQYAADQVQRTYSKDDIDECIRKELSYDPNIDMKSYKGLSIEYFNEIKDYVSEDAIDIQNEIERYKEIIKKKESVDISSNKTKDSTDQDLIKIKADLDSLNKKIRQYRKVAVGYVFVHKFISGEDTLKRIFVMDKNCNETDIIPVKSNHSLNPDDFRNKVNHLRQQTQIQ